MKIVYDHQIFAMQEHGGVSRYFVELAQQLAARPDVQVNLLAPIHFNRYLEHLNLNTTFGYRIPKFPMYGKIIQPVNRLITRSWLQKHTPDIIHATYYAPIKKAPGSKAKVVVTVHDMIHELYPDSFVSHDHTAQLKLDAVQKADHVICVSHNTRSDLIRLTGIDSKMVSVVHHGVNRIEPANTIDVPYPQKPYMLYIGQRGGYKNFSRLLSVYAGSNELRSQFNLICFGGGKFTVKEQSEQKHLGLSKDQIQWFAGNDALLARLYNNASVYICSSLYEGFGMPLLEAMSFNCPVVCSNGGSIPEVVGEAGEFFDPFDEADMLRAITKVLNDSSHAAELQRKSVDQLRKFSWSKCAKKTLEVYQSLV